MTDPHRITTRLARLGRPYAAVLAASTVLRVVQLLLGVAVLATAAYALARPDAVGVAELVALVVGLAAAKGAAHYGEQYWGHWVAFHLLARLRIRVFEALARQSPAVLHRHRSGDLTARATTDVNRLEVFYAHTVAPAAAAVLVTATVTGIVAGWAHPGLAAILLAAAVLSGLAVPRLGRRRVAAATHDRQQLRGRVAAHIADALGGLRELRTLRATGQWRAGLDTLETGVRRGTRTVVTATALRRAANTAVWAAAVVAVATAGGWWWHAGELTLAGWWTTVAATVALAPALTAVEAFASEFGTTRAAARRLFTLWEAAPGQPSVPADEAADGTAAGRPAGRGTPDQPAAPGSTPATGPTVELHQVSYRYPGVVPGQPTPIVLRDLDLTLPGGSFTAVLGPTGGGKSTLGALLARCAHPTGGRITFDGVDVATMPEQLLRRTVTLVDQRPFFFAGTVASNLRLADPAADDAALWWALSIVELADTVRALPGELAAPMRERGESLSGGQLQRLALAQGLLRRPALLVCDEVTSQLDDATETRLVANLRRALAGTTTVWITHRPATAAVADQRVTLDDHAAVSAPRTVHALHPID